MLSPPTHCSVLIVGAGPSGLMMAAQLLRYGLVPVIIDTKQGPTSQSKALAVQARSLEIYRQMGVIDRVLSGGKQASGVSFNKDGQAIASLPMNAIEDAGTMFPYILLYQQSKNERLLLDELTTGCCPVYWQTSLQSLKQTATGYEAQLQSGEATFAITCDYIVGADGAHSIVRKQLGIPFSGDTYAHKFYLADVKIDKVFNGDNVQLFMSKTDFAGFFPMPEEDCYRVVASIPDELADHDTLELDAVLPHLRQLTGKAIEVQENHWFTQYKLHHRMADKFADGRSFLIGDAAHIHSPVGGQGMNTGLQDAYNLAWKLAGVVNGQFTPAILTTYAEERMPVAKMLLNTTDRIFNIITSRSIFGSMLKQYIMPAALKFMWKREKVRTEFFKRVSQTGISYRDSKLSRNLGHQGNIRAGDRLPYLEIFDEKKKEKTDLHAWCNKPGFTLITMGEIKENYLFSLAKWLTQQYNSGINFFHLPSSSSNQHIFDAFQVRPGHRKAIIVRPDMHIGYLNDMVDMEMMDAYLRDVVGFKG
ncbi:FAD-dependent monooxygenase [Mucilaginibacter pedocola]|uniref:FAD-binding domain-containing protein n=1 Tax=Mucilaginibacter pedocola TaxID=1792845 RepID=A0A1S9PCE6_9SPHI|nr:FAD-dependent monooxygenase [Mucilaginibacter pedocola]OOQ58591.1 hypothetical protein BC343_07965 [Mucilaginibacter pedocola]